MGVDSDALTCYTDVALRGEGGVSLVFPKDFSPLPLASLPSLNIALSYSPMSDDSLTSSVSTPPCEPAASSLLDDALISTPTYQYVIPNPTYALVDTPCSDVIPFPLVNLGFVTVCKPKKSSKGGMCGLKVVIREQSFVNPRVAPLSSRGLDYSTIISPSTQALRYCAALFEVIT